MTQAGQRPSKPTKVTVRIIRCRFYPKWNIGERVELDAWWRYVDSLPALDISSYHTLDLRLAVQLNPSLELAIVGQNLLDNNHQEFTSTTAISTGVARGFYAQLTGRFK